MVQQQAYIAQVWQQTMAAVLMAEQPNDLLLLLNSIDDRTPPFSSEEDFWECLTLQALYPTGP